MTENMSQKELKKEWKTYKIISKPEGNPTFIDPKTGVEREYMRVHHGKYASEKDAKRVVEFSNWDNHIANDEPLYEIVSLEEE